MFFNCQQLLGLAALLAPAAAIPLASSKDLQSRLPLPYRVLDQLKQNGTSLENIETRHNGDLVISLTQPVPKLFLIREPWKEDAQLSLIHTFGNADGLLGLAQVGPDHFVVSTTKWGSNVAPVANSSTVREFQLHPDGTLASQGYVGRYPEAGLLNGMAALPGCSSKIILSADSVQGVIHKIDTRTGVREVAIDVPELKLTNPQGLALAANGLKIHDGYVYWTNSNLVGIYRIAIDGKTGHALEGAEVETVADLSDEYQVLDDFAVDKAGNVWALTNVGNNLLVVRPDGSYESVLGAETELVLAGATSARFGVTSEDSHILYVPTSGGINAPVNGTIVVPGSVVAVDTRKYYF